MTEGQYSLVWPEVRLVSCLLYGTLAKLFYFEFGSFENQKIHSLWPFPWKRSEWQNPDQVRTNQNSKIYWKTTLPYDNNKYCEDKSESISQRKYNWVPSDGMNLWPSECLLTELQRVCCWVRPWTELICNKHPVCC